MFRRELKARANLSDCGFLNSPIITGSCRFFRELSMKLLCNVGSVVSMVLIAVGFSWMWRLGLFGSGLSICILGLICGPSLAFGLYALHLRDRIAALERRAQERQ